MRWLIRLERHFDWLAFPGLFKYLTFLSAIVYLAQWIRPDIGLLLDFNRERILHGEVWRIVTYLFAFRGTGGLSGFGVFFLFFAIQLCIMINDALEATWGPTRLTLYILVFWASNTALQFLLGGFPFSAAALYSTIFFAFATLFPHVRLLVMFILPVEVRWLALIGLLIAILGILQNPILLILALPAMLPYMLWVLPDLIHSRKTLVKAAIRRQKFNATQPSEHEPFHRCVVCGRTERDSADLEFRVTTDGKEYCQDHLP